VAFDVLRVNGHDVTREPWADRRKRLEDIGAARDAPAACVPPQRARNFSRMKVLRPGMADCAYL
jgi:ATP-dependent DNA ligase